MRSVGSAVLVIVALLLAAVAGPAIWAERNVVSESGFVALAGPLGANKDFQQGLTTVVATQSAAQLDLPPQLQNLAAGVIKSAARTLYTQPGYAEAWAETLRRSHALTFTPDAGQQGRGSLNLDIAPMVGLVATKVSADLGVNLPAPKEVLISMDQPTVARAIPAVTTLGGWGIWLAIFAVVLLVLAIVVARNRSLTTVLAGLGLALVALAWALASGFVAGQFANLGTGNEVAAQFGSELGALAKNSWQWGITFTFILAAGLVIGGGAARMVRRISTP
ncbi:hypothetical protein [Arthrobacter sp. ERGS1:01]|uniref:hypothetical protein n=1 Tax=Arthrobacter sp. ERGS1:01 TaxID=1704044 RepID=UPI0006B4F44B|nr:hypothetical protein [Arthrobacter sp. ERGS1:01]